MITIYQNKEFTPILKQMAISNIFIYIAQAYDDCYLLSDAQINYENALLCLKTVKDESYDLLRKQLDVYEALIDIQLRQANVQEAIATCLLCENEYQKIFEYCNQESLYEANKKLCLVK